MQWEYETVKIEPKDNGLFAEPPTTIDTDKLRQVLNEMGSNGWELVTSFGLNVRQGWTGEVVLLFKRQVP